MSEEYNPQAQTIEDIERLEIELKELIRKRQTMTDPQERKVIEEQISDRRALLKQLQAKLV